MCDGLVQNERVKVGKKSGPVLNRLWTKVHEIVGQRRKPFVLSKPLPDCLFHVSFCRCSPISLEVVEKPNKWKRFWSPFFPGWMTPTFLQHTVSAIYHSLFGKVWLSWISVCEAWQWSGMQNLSPFWSCLWVEVHVAAYDFSLIIKYTNSITSAYNDFDLRKL